MVGVHLRGNPSVASVASVALASEAASSYIGRTLSPNGGDGLL